MNALLDRLRRRPRVAGPPPPEPPRDLIAAMRFLSLVSSWESARGRAVAAEADLAAARAAVVNAENQLRVAAAHHDECKYESPAGAVAAAARRMRDCEAAVDRARGALVSAQFAWEAARGAQSVALAEVVRGLDDAEDASRELEVRSARVQATTAAARAASAAAGDRLADAGGRATNPRTLADLHEGMAGDRVGRARAAVAETKAALVRAEEAGREQQKAREVFDRCVSAALAAESKGGRPR